MGNSHNDILGIKAPDYAMAGRWKKDGTATGRMALREQALFIIRKALVS
ncbi:hypothetical protein [Endozoicomonas numazuensis]|nr:hypothetical protein [Endozoicomonas numazuensis]